MKSIIRKTGCEAETAKLGRDIAMAISAGSGKADLLLLSGDLGAGKTALARSLIRQIAGDDDFEVPSPTYTLCHEYDLEISVAHYDLYRLSSLEELDELGWQEQLETGIAIMEWPERCFDAAPKNAVQVTIEQITADTREIALTGEGSFIERIERSLEIADFLINTNLETPSRKHLSADASARSYEIISDKASEYFLMNSPAMPDGPIVRDGKPYSQIAHLAETVDAFVGVAKLLRNTGATAPEIPFFDLHRGLLLIEHLGSEGILDEARKPIPERYLASAEFLAELHQNTFENEIEISDGRSHTVPNYDEQAILIEAELLLDWYAPAHSETKISDDKAAEFKTIWQALSDRLADYEKSLVLRDYHSPNILWLDKLQGTKRVGVIDFQDALIGPSSYDVASLAQDARVDISATLETEIVEHYIQARLSRGNPFSEHEFRESYAIMAAQRATKILGIFIRLNERDGKPEYLKHLPRMRDYLKRSLKHPVLNPYRNWIESVMNL